MFLKFFNCICYTITLKAFSRTATACSQSFKVLYNGVGASRITSDSISSPLITPFFIKYSNTVLITSDPTYRHYTVPDHPIQGTNTVYRTIRVHGAPRIRECDTKLGRMHYR